MTPGSRSLWSVPEALVGALLVFCVVLDGVNVFARYVLLSPIVAAEEILGYILVWSVFIGAVLVTRDGEHLRMDLLSTALGGRTQKVLRTLEYALTLAVCGLVAYKCLQAARLIADLGERTIVLGVPMIVPFAALPAGFALMAAVAAWKLWPRRGKG